MKFKYQINLFRFNHLFDSFQKSKDYRSMVFETLDSPPRENVDIGGRGTELCSGVPIVWLNPVPEDRKHNDVDDDDDLYIDTKSNLNMSKFLSYQIILR